MTQPNQPDRTELAGDRTILAGERTLAAWWRTAITALAAAIGLVQLLGETGRTTLVRGAATLPVLLALLVLFFAARRYVHTARRIENETVTRVPVGELWIGTGLLTALALAAGALVWTM